MPFADCGQAYQAWGAGRLDFSQLIDGALVLHDGTRCPISETPWHVPVEVTIPPGTPYIRPELAETGSSWGLWVLGIALALVVFGLLLLAFARPRRKEAGVGGRHHWPGGADVDDSGGDVELLAAVTGLGPEQDTGSQAWVDAAELPTEGWELRGGRDVDPSTSNPWRADG